MGRRRDISKGTPIPNLINRTEIRIRFNEVDSLRYVWHGHYVQYFEDGREGFGREFDLGYLRFYEEGFAVPLVKVVCDFKKPLYYGDEAIVETQFIDCKAAKIIFRFKIFRKSDNQLVCEGESVQVFTTPEGELILNIPDFFQKWKDLNIKHE